MKRKLYLLSSLMLVMAMTWPKSATSQNNVSVWDGGAEFWTQGEGTASSPYLIENARQLAAIAELVNAGVNQYDNTYFRLTTDVYIDSNTVWQPIGLNSTYYFGGHFDGNNHTVTLYLITSDMNYAGIFGYAKNGSFSNLTSDGQVERTGSGAAYVGGICGYSTATFTNCHNTGNISSVSSSVSNTPYAGGICGYSTATFTNCHNTGSVFSSYYAGGICGYSTASYAFPNCHNSGSVSSSNSFNYTASSSGNNTYFYYSSYAGGICGYSTASYAFPNCYNTGDISSASASPYSSNSSSSYSSIYYAYSYSGGICGYSGYIITDCYNTGNISSSRLSSSANFSSYSYAGGICGYGYSISKCYNLGDISASESGACYSGGICGSTNSIINCYNMGNIASKNYSGGICGNAGNTIKNCYNVGSLLSGTKGGISGNSGTVTNCYYLNTCGHTASTGGTAKTAASMKSVTFPVILNSDSVAFVTDITPTLNDGYPVFGRVSTQNANNVGATTATLRGSYQMRYAVDAHGFEYKKSSESSYTTVNASGSSPVSYNVSGLQGGTEYTYRFFIQKNGATYRGADMTFTTAVCSLSVQISSSSTGLCEGDVITYTAVPSGGAGYQYTWSNGSHSNTINVSNNSTYTVTVTDNIGCQATASKQTTLYPAVTVSISGNTVLGSNGSTTLTASGANSYHWNTGSTTASITVSPTTNTTYTVTGTNQYGCTGTASVTVTVCQVPTVTTNTVSNIGTTSATCGGNVTSTGGASITARGVCWGTSQNPTINDNHTNNNNNNSGTGSFTSSITGLTPNTTYYVKAYATNSAGTSYGAQKTFTTECNTVNVSIAGTTSINYGGSTTLTASGANSYSWSIGSSTNASITVSPTTNTTYTVTGTNQYGCTGTASATVTVCQVPTVTTNTVSNIGTTSATCGGNVTADGGDNVTVRGVCWSTSQNPTVSGSHTTNGNGTGSFTSSITGLTPNTTYYVKAYATNSAGTSYGTQRTFTTECNTVNVSIAGTTTINYGGSTTLTASGANSYSWNTGGTNASITVNPTSSTTYTVTGTDSYGCTGTANVTVTVNSIKPTVTTNTVSNIGTTSATCGGKVTSTGGADVTARGVCWSTSQNPTVNNSHTTNGNGSGSFTSSITGLAPNTTYYVKAYATNSAGTSYGTQKTFTTLCNTVNISIAGSTSIDDGQSTTLTASGANSYSWSTGGTNASITVSPTTNTTYTVTGTNQYGCTGTANVTVTVNYLAPTVKTNNVSDIAQTSATCGGNVTSGGSTTVTARGVCWSTSHNPTISDVHTTDGNGTGAFSSSLTGLEPSTTYYVRAYATNSISTAYGNEVSFTTTNCSNIYLPLVEDFESYTASTTASTGVQPDCWNLVLSDVPMTDANRPQLYYKSTYAHSGDYSLLLNYRGVYAMPALSENVPMSRVKLEMYLRQPKSYYALEVGAWEDDGTFVLVTTFNNSGTGVEFVECDFSAYTGNGRRIAFRNVLSDGSDYNYSYNYIDDIVLTEICDPISLPYSENFESYTASTNASTGVQPNCWELVHVDVPMTEANRPQLYYKSSYAHSGDYSLLLNYRGIYAMPALSENMPMNNVKLEMYLRQPKAAYQLEVGVYEDDGTFVPVTTFNNSGTGVELVECDFSAYTGNGHRIAFRNILGGGANYNYSYNYIDDIVLTSICDPIPFPYTETFESYTASTTASTGVQPDCWNLVREDVAMTEATRPQLYYKSSYAHSGKYSLLLNYRGVYAMPALSEDVPMNNVKLEMYLRQPKAAYQLEVGVYEYDGTFVPVATFNNSGTGVEFVTCDFSSYTGNGRRVAFRNVLGGGANYNYSYNYLDDIALSYLCEPIIPPYSEDFESYTASTTASTGVQPDCWELVQADVTMTDASQPQLYYKSSFAHSGNYSLKMGYRGVYAMSALSGEVPMNNVKLEMYLRQPNAAYQLEVGVWDGQEFVPVRRINNSTTEVEHVACDFSTYTGNGHRIAFRNVLGGGANYSYSYNYIDDIVLTVCNPISLPYAENFESFTESTTASTGVEPDCWDLVREDVAMTDATRPQLYYKSSYAHSGNYSLKMGYRGIYAMPALSEEVPMDNVRLEMYLRQPNAAYRLEVGVWDDMTQTFEVVKLFNNSTTNVEHVTCDFSNYTGNGRRIAFRNVLGGGANYNYSYNYLDDIVLTPICGPVSLPYSENFDTFTESTTSSTGVEPDCWELVREDVAMTDANRPQLYYKSSYAHSGSYSLLLNYRGVYAMPALSEEVPMNDVKLKMYLRQPKAAYQLEVGVWNGQEFELVQRINNSGTGVEFVECDFSNYTGNGHRIAFRNVLGSGNYNYSYNYIDDITLGIRDGSPCLGAATVTDHEGNVYNTVKIGRQCWTKENLRTTTSPSTGTYLIPIAGRGSTYTGKQARWYNNDSATYAPLNYGLLYNWNAAVDTFNTAYGETSVNMSSSNAMSVTFNGYRRGICPAGWHLPSDAEWTTLTNYVSSQSEYTCGGDSSYIAKALASTEGWGTSSNTCAAGNNPLENNASGFGAVPAGGQYGEFYNAGYIAHFWSSTQYDSDSAYIRSLYYGHPNLYRFGNKEFISFSVRCLRDNDANGGTHGETIFKDTCDSYIWHGTTYTASGTYTYSYTNADGYENVDTLHLTIHYGTNNVVWVYACDPYIHFWHGTAYTASGTYTYSYSNADGCENVDTLHLTIYSLPPTPSLTVTDNTSCAGLNGSITVTSPIGDGFTYSIDGTNFQTEVTFTGLGAGSYTVTVMNADYCTSSANIEIYNTGNFLSVVATANSPCAGDDLQLAGASTGGVTYNWFGPAGQTYTGQYLTIPNATADMNGVYTLTVIDPATGCSATGAIFVEVREPSRGDTVVITCGNYEWHGIEYTETPTTAPQFTYKTVDGCDSIVTLHLTVFHSDTVEVDSVVCENELPLTWHGVTFNAAGTQTLLLSNTYGCDSVVVMTLNVNSFSPVIDEKSCPAAPTVTDYDGNVYATVQIGDQCWMRENLRTTRYADGTAIQAATSTSTSIPCRYAPDNDTNNVPFYGYLYNWPAIMHGSASSSANPSEVQGICPLGWHVPSDGEWLQLTDFVSSQDQFLCSERNTLISKALADTIAWGYNVSTCSIGNMILENNSTGFSARPAGYYGKFNGSSNGSYVNFGQSCFFWSTTEGEDSNAWEYGLYSNDAFVYRDNSGKHFSFSIRCVRNEQTSSLISEPIVTTKTIISITDNAASCGGNIIYGGSSEINMRGVCWSTSQNPTIGDNHTSDGSGTGNFYSSLTGLTPNTTYYVRAYATNSIGTSYGNVVSFSITAQGQPCPGYPTVTDIDNNIYNTVQIGNQCWMKENLRTTHYSDNTEILFGMDSSYTTAYYYYPANEVSLKNTFGLLYNWKAVNGYDISSSSNSNYVQGICPNGWHVPSVAEWTQLTDNVSILTQTSNCISRALARSLGWNFSSNWCSLENASNVTGFSAIPAGYYAGSVGFYSIGGSTSFWLADEANNNIYGWKKGFSAEGNMTGGNIPKYYGYSVRCLRDNPVDTQDTCTILTLPHSETFETYTTSTTASTGVEPDCWDLVREDVAMTDATRPQLYYKSSYAHSGNYSLKMGYRGIYAMPALSEEVPMDNVRLEMYLRQPNAAYRLEVGVWDDMTQTFEVVKLFNNSTTNVEHVTCDFSNYTGSGRRIAFRNVLGSGNYNYSYNYIDDITLDIRDGSPCLGAATVTDHEGNVYNTVKIGNQCWMRDNLRTTTSPSTGTYLIPPAGTGSTHTGKQAFWYNNDSVTYAPMNYGLLYNWNAAVDTFNTAYGETSVNSNSSNAVSVTFSGHRRGICPAGWHLPSDAEWTQLTNYVKTRNDYVCGDTNINIAKALSSTEGWFSHSDECVVGNDQSSNNATGFSAVPAGNGGGSSFISAGSRAYFWSSSECSSNNAYSRHLGYYSAYVDMLGISKPNGYSVRCLRDSIVCVDNVPPIFNGTLPDGHVCPSDDGTNIVPDYNNIGTYFSTHNKYYIPDFTSYFTNETVYDNLYPFSSLTITQNPAAGTEISTTTEVTITLSDPCGNESLYSIEVVPNQIEWWENMVVACDSYTWWNGHTFTQTDTTTVVLQNVWGCDSIVTLLLYVIESDRVELDSVVCESELPFTWNGVTFTGAGTQTVVFTNSVGCDSVVVMTLNVSSCADGQPCLGTPTVTYDGYVYNTVKIGNQCWMKQNLRTTHYADGTSIPLGNETSTTTAYRYYPNNSSTNVSTYGYLYNWKAVMRNSSSSNSNPSSVQGICPTGWHVPSDAEWTQLTDYVSGKSQYVCGNTNTYIAKALAGTTKWNSSSSNTCDVGYSLTSNNATGFNALPAGSYYGNYFGFGDHAFFWSSTQNANSNAYFRYLLNTLSYVTRDYDAKSRAGSIRCLRDNTNNKSDESSEDPNTAIPDDTSLEMADIDATLSVKEFTDASINVTLYPNPTRDYINVQCTMNNEQLEVKGIEVIDVYGKVVRTVVGANNYSPTQINVSGLAAGMYFVRVTTNKGAVTKTFVKK